jgi:hypothetical protein
MNFKLERFFYLTTYCILGTFFCVVGAFILLLPWSSFLQILTSQWLTQYTFLFSCFGFGLVLIGFSTVFYACVSNKYRYLHIRIGPRAVSLDEKLIHNYLETYWQQLFPDTPPAFVVHLKKQNVQIIAEFPFLSVEQQKEFLKQVEDDLSHLFRKIFGYSQEIHLFANFQSDREPLQTKEKVS